MPLCFAYIRPYYRPISVVPMGTSDATASQLSCSQINGVSLYVLSPLSEPPDVRNWFSSYEYESPSQDSSFPGLDVDSSAHDDASDVSFPKPTTETSVEKSLVVETRKKESIAVVVIEEDLEGARKNNVVLQDVSWDKGYLYRRENGFVHDRESLSPDNNTSNDIGKEKSTERDPSLHSGKECVLHHQFEGEHILNGYNRELSEENEFEKTVRALESNGGSSECGYGSSSGCYQEQEKTAICAFESTEDGQNSKGSKDRWMSTKILRDCPGNERPSRKQNPSIKQEIVELVPKECNILRKRDALVDQTNIVPGKWHCPSRSKPYLGPPMKQLRLEHWVNRATQNNMRF